VPSPPSRAATSDPKILIAVPEPLRGRILTEQARDRLHSLGTIVYNEQGRNWTGSELADRLHGVDVLLASWGLAPLTEDVLARADRLRLVAYAAGSVKAWATEAVFRRRPGSPSGIAIAHAAHRIADSVAEFSLMAALAGLRQAAWLDRRMRAGARWPGETPQATHEIRGCRVGVLGMGHVGQRAAKLFQAVGAEVWAYDPYLPTEGARARGVRLAELEELLKSCLVVSVHLPVTDETRHLLGARELGLIQDGAVLVNTARACVIDGDALLRELATGRFWAALDVYDEEPPPADHALRSMENVLLTPHVAGQTTESHTSLLGEMVDETARFVRGEPLQHQVTADMLATMA